MVDLISPKGMKFDDWAASMVVSFSSAVLPSGEDSWREWACEWGKSQERQDSFPDPNQFSTWQDWGERLLQTWRPA